MSTVPDPTQRPTWAEIDRAAFRRNVEAVIARLPAGVRLAAVLKANAYGHGAVEIAKTCCTPDRVSMLVVALLEEALELRRNGVTFPIFVFTPLTCEQVAIALDHDVTIGVVGPEELRIVCEYARERDVSIHLKLDTGMGRMGVMEGELGEVVEVIQRTPRLHVEAVYTHFANANDPHDPLTVRQIEKFRDMLASLRARGIDPPHRHLANSAATMRDLLGPGDIVRVGISLYGGQSVDDTPVPYEPVLRWRTEIMRLKDVPPGYGIGYGTTFHTGRRSRIATCPVGYADGYARQLSNKADVIVRGRRAPVVGRVSMDLITIDVTDIPEAAYGDEVTLLGDGITAEELARKAGTINHEVFCRITSRVPRIYR